MRLKLLVIGLFVYNFGFSQSFEVFTTQEKELIQSNPNQMMRVYNLTKPKDSLVLKSVSIPVNPTDKLTQALAERMLLSVNDPINKGVGIAAPQVGINRRLILVQRFDKPNRPFEVFINPEIIWASELYQKGPEGDLSFEENGLVLRNYIVQIKYQNLKGNTVTEILEGFTAVIFQHERDHLDGILLTDRIQQQKEISVIPSNQNLNLFLILD